MNTALHISTPRTTVRLLQRGTLVDLVLVSAATAAISLLVKLAWPRFTFWGDNAESFFPLWHVYGASIRSGAPGLFQADGWAGGNVVGEAAYGVFNPVVVLNSILISFTDRLSLASFLVMTEFLCLLAAGVYLLARSYGARRAAALAVGAAIPFAGFTLFYEAGNWASGLMSITWVAWFWWAAHEHSRRRRGPLAAIVTGVLAATVGNPYAVLGVLVVMFGLACELLAARRWRELGPLLLVGATVGLAVLAVYMPLLLTLPETVRATSGTVSNKNYLTPGLGDLLGMSSPSYLPRMNAWYSRWDAVPSSYLSWVILPLLPWIRWRSAFLGSRLLSIFISGGLYVLLCLGPQQIWLFQWPVRMLEYANLAILVVFAVLMSARLARDHLATRSVLSACAVAFAFFVAWSSKPELWAWHLLFATITAVGVGAILALAPRFAARAVAILLVAGTAVIAPMQATLFAWDTQDVAPELDQLLPVNLQTLRDRGADFRGTVLQVASLRDLEDTDAVASGDLSFGNGRTAAGFDAVNRYTGIGFLAFAEAAGIDYRGSAPNDRPLSRFFDELPGYDVPLIEAMNVGTLVVSTAASDRGMLPELADEWTVREESAHRIVLTAPWSDDFRVFATRGLTVGAAASDGADASMDIVSGSGTVLLPRLAWHGWRAHSDSRQLEVRAGPAGLLEVVVPEGTKRVDVSYRIPGIDASILLFAALLIVTAAQQFVFFWRRSALARVPEGSRRTADSITVRPHADLRAHLHVERHG